MMAIGQNASSQYRTKYTHPSGRGLDPLRRPRSLRLVLSSVKTYFLSLCHGPNNHVAIPKTRNTSNKTPVTINPMMVPGSSIAPGSWYHAVPRFLN